MLNLKTELIKKISGEVSSMAASIWLDDCGFTGRRNGRIEIEASSEFKRKMLEKRLGEIIGKAVNELTGNEEQVYFTVLPENRKKDGAEEYYCFEDFVKGKGNELALATVLAATDNPSEKLKCPVYIYGMKNMGKTHLLRSAEKRVSDILPKTGALYTTAAEFVELFGVPQKKYIIIDDFNADEAGKMQAYIKQALGKGTNIIAAGEKTPDEDTDTGNFLLPGTDIMCTPADIQAPDVETLQAINTVVALRKGIIL